MKLNGRALTIVVVVCGAGCMTGSLPADGSLPINSGTGDGGPANGSNTPSGSLAANQTPSSTPPSSVAPSPGSTNPPTSPGGSTPSTTPKVAPPLPAIFGSGKMVSSDPIAVVPAGGGTTKAKLTTKLSIAPLVEPTINEASKRIVSVGMEIKADTTVTFPAGASPVITITSLGSMKGPDGTISPIYDIQPHNTTFDKPVTISMKLPPGTNRLNIGAVHVNGNTYVGVAAVPTGDQDTIAFDINGFSYVYVTDVYDQIYLLPDADYEADIDVIFLPNWWSKETFTSIHFEPHTIQLPQDSPLFVFRPFPEVKSDIQYRTTQVQEDDGEPVLGLFPEQLMAQNSATLCLGDTNHNRQSATGDVGSQAKFAEYFSGAGNDLKIFRSDASFNSFGLDTAHYHASQVVGSNLPPATQFWAFWGALYQSWWDSGASQFGINLHCAQIEKGGWYSLGRVSGVVGPTGGNSPNQPASGSWW